MELANTPVSDNAEVSKDAKEDSKEESRSDTFGPFSGQVISIVKDLCKKAFLNAQPRIVEGMYLCSLQAPTPEAYGVVYNIMDKCRGTIISEDVEEGTNCFLL